MKRFLALAAVSLTVVACGSSDGSEPAVTPNTPQPGSGEPDALGGTPTDADVDEQHGVFVSPRGNDSAQGTRGAPFATLGAAIRAVGTSGKRVFACLGEYKETIEVANGVQMVGGLSCSEGTWSLNKGRSKVIAPTSPAMHAKDVTGLTRIESFEVIAPDGNDTNISSFGLIAENSKGLVLANMRIAAGKGLDGVDGTNGTQLTAQYDGPQAARMPTMASSCANSAACLPRVGANPGITKCNGAAGFVPQSGGRGGTSGVFELHNDVGQGGQWIWKRIGAEPEARTNAAGTPGTDGSSAVSGAFDATGYLAGSGTAGTNGGTGAGGTGGRGDFPQATWTTADPSSYDAPLYGNEGGGGGGGGCPGLAGTPGTGGGASVAVLLFDSAISIVTSELVASDGGAGGRGTLGSSATLGGPGGAATSSPTAGISGGPGGRAGVSGHGAGGPSHAVASHGNAPTIDDKTKLTIGIGGLGRDAVSDGVGGNARTIPASSSGEASNLHSF